MTGSIDPSPVAVFFPAGFEYGLGVLDSLAIAELADRSDVFVYCDGRQHEEISSTAHRVREHLDRSGAFRSFEVVERPKRMGESQSLVAGVTEVLRRHDRVIVLDASLRVSPSFLRFMNEALTLYADEERVIGISGYSYARPEPRPDTYFLSGSHCWGWGTWRRGWELFEPDPETLLRKIVRRRRVHAFDGGGAEPLTKWLSDSIGNPTMSGSWVLRWLGSAVVADKLTLFPGRSLVVHDQMSAQLPPDLVDTILTHTCPRVAPVPIQEDVAAERFFKRAFIRQRVRHSPRMRLYSLLARLLPTRIEEQLYSALVERSLAPAPRSGGLGGHS